MPSRRKMLFPALGRGGVPLREHAVAFVRGVLDSLGLEWAALMGNSMGGYFRLSRRLIGTRLERFSDVPGFGLLGRPGPGDKLRPELSGLKPETLQLVPNGRCEDIPDAGHPRWIDQPTLSARLVSSCLA